MRNLIDRDPAGLISEEITAIEQDIHAYDDGDPLAVERLKAHLTAFGFSYESNKDALQVGGAILALWSNYY